MDYEEIQTGELLKWDKPGVEIEGVLHGYDARDTAKGEGHVYKVKNKDGVTPFFAPSLLHEKLQEIAIGRIVKITYEKETPTGSGNTVKHFTVLHCAPTDANLKEIGIEKFEEAGGGEDVEPKA